MEFLASSACVLFKKKSTSDHRVSTARQITPSFAISTASPGNEWARTAPVLAAVVMNPTRAATVNGMNYAPFDAGLATENLILAAVAEGLVAHPMAGFDEPAARQALAVPDPWRIVAVVAIGFAGDPARLDAATREKDERPRQRLPVERIAFFDRWAERE